MSIFIDENLPAYEILKAEDIDVHSKDSNIYKSKCHSALNILILNLMPQKSKSETQLIRRLGSSLLNINITLLKTKTHKSKNTDETYLSTFYKTIDEIKDKNFDGAIITGAPIELLKFEEVDYFNELKEIFDYCKEKVKSTLYICWGAQAGLYYHYGIPKYELNKKLFGVFSHKLITPSKLTKMFDDEFYAPHSRYTYTKREDVLKCDKLQIIAESNDAGVYMVQSKDLKSIFVTGHSEYDKFTLYDEYKRDLNKNIDIDIPKNYFLNDDPNNKPIVKWRSHGNILFSNWLNILNSL